MSHSPGYYLTGDYNSPQVCSLASSNLFSPHFRTTGNPPLTLEVHQSLSSKSEMFFSFLGPKHFLSILVSNNLDAISVNQLI